MDEWIRWAVGVCLLLLSGLFSIWKHSENRKSKIIRAVIKKNEDQHERIYSIITRSQTELREDFKAGQIELRDDHKALSAKIDKIWAYLMTGVRDE